MRPHLGFTRVWTACSRFTQPARKPELTRSPCSSGGEWVNSTSVSWGKPHDHIGSTSVHREQLDGGSGNGRGVRTHRRDEIPLVLQL